MKVEVIRPEPGHDVYEVKVEYSTYFYDRTTYNALYHAFRENPADDVIWSSTVTDEMVMDAEDCGAMIDELDDFVADTVMHYWKEGHN